VSIDFSPKITLIGGANETGKSTLVDALHRTLFLKATATGAPVQALRSKLHLGHPTIEIKFEAKCNNYILQKYFTGSSGQIKLLNETNGNQLTGPLAEECLAGLLGVKESLGSNQARSTLPNRWAHLWVMQGAAGNNLLKRDKSCYDFDSLLAQLEEKGGATIQQSAQDQRVIKQIDEAIELNFTSKGVKKNSALWHREMELKKAEQNLDMNLSKLQEYEHSSEELVQISKNIEQLQNTDLPKLFEQKQQISQKADARIQLEREITLTKKELEPLRIRYEIINKTFLDIKKLHADIQTKEEAQKTLLNKQNEKKTQEIALNNNLKKIQEFHSNLKKDRKRMEQQRNLLQLLVEQFRLKEDICELKVDLKKAEKNLKSRKELEQQIHTLPKINRTKFKFLQELYQKLHDTKTRQDAMATGIEVIRSNNVIIVDGEELKLGVQKQLSKKFQIQVGDSIFIEIKPGGSDTLNDLYSKYENQKKEFSDALSELGLESLQIAEKHLEQRENLEMQLSCLEKLSPEHIQTKEKELESFELDALNLDEQLKSFKLCLEDLVKENPLPNTLIGLGNLYQQVTQNFNHTSKAFEQACIDLEVAQSNLQKFKNEQFNDESNSKVIESELSGLRQNLSTLKKEYVDHEILKTQINSLHSQIKELEVLLETQNNRLKSMGEINNSNELLTIEAEIESLEKKKELLISEKGAAKRSCEDICSSNPFEAFEKAKVQLEIAKADYLTLKRITDSHKLLQDLFSNVQADLSTRYTKPLAQSIENFLKPLISDGPAAQLSFDPTDGFTGLKMRRGKEFYDFDQLSGGMKEQLTAALRLSMADVLKSEHDGCLPLVFDDAFTNSDPKRVEIIKIMLQSAVKKGLQVILLSCDPKAYEEFADKQILLD
tara:strand:+ start:7819 stop:10485 length:2667 start_codon:yes stop_codon:yes gene_type:complete